MGEHSLIECYRLDGRDRATVLEAVDRGQRVEGRLRPAARGLAETSLHRWGLDQLRRRPGRIAALIAIDIAVITFIIIKGALTGAWWPVWLLVIVIGVSLANVWNMERQGRRLRPKWQQTIDANRDPS